MNKVLATSLVGCAICASGSALAQVGAQAPTQQPQYFTVRVGAAFALDSKLSNLSSTYFGLGADYTFSRQWFKNGETFLSIDWLTNMSGGHTRFNWFPICINERLFTNSSSNVGTNVGNNGQTYFFVGLGGAYFDNIQQFGFGGRAGVGYQFAGNFVAEAAFTATVPTRQPNRVTGDSLGLYIGYKFGG